MTKIRNNFISGYYNDGVKPVLTKIDLLSKGVNPLLAQSIDFTNIDLYNSFVYPDDTTAPVLIGSADGVYFDTVEDGFVIRDSSSTCLSIEQTTTTYSSMFQPVLL